MKTNSLSFLALSFSLLASMQVVIVSANDVPKLEAQHPSIEQVTLFAANPDIVTPIGVAVAPDGRVFVQENHTHKRGKDYDGPEKDRILVFEDTDGDGVADKRSVFYDGLVFSTDLLFGPDGHLYVATRWFIGRLPMFDPNMTMVLSSRVPDFSLTSSRPLRNRAIS